MHPVLWQGLGLRLPTYGAMLFVGFLLAVALLRARASALGLDRDRMTVVAAQLILAGTLGSRLWFVLAEPGAFVAQPWRVVALWNGGHVWYGALAGGLLALAWHARRTADPRALGDLFLPAASVAHFCGRLGCFAAGCCWGRPTAVAWAVTFPAESLCAVPGTPLHPAQLYEAAGEGVISVVLLALWRRRHFAGEVGLAYLGLYAALRLAVEPWRGDAARGFVVAGAVSVAQCASLVLLAGTAVVWSVDRRRRYSPRSIEERRRCTTPSSTP
jgi:phosphatidylglycerol---prolipoprotein diacylglyceryl transferase